jgi:hypothetical protein
VLSLVSTLSVMVEQINRLETEIADALDVHPDGPVFRSFFVSQTAVLCPATLLAEIGNSRARYPHRDAIAAQAGHAPVADVRQTQERQIALGLQPPTTQRPEHPRAINQTLEHMGR